MPVGAVPTPGAARVGPGCAPVDAQGLSLSVIVRGVVAPGASWNVGRSAIATGGLERFRRARAFAVRPILSVPPPPDGSARRPVPTVVARLPRPRRFAV